jgi:hypothetical protein
MTTNTNKICPCTLYDSKSGKEKPGYRYDGGEYKYNFPCFAYDPMNRTSQKAAMKMALKTGEAEIEKIRREVEEEMQREEIKKSMTKKSQDNKSY